MSAVPKTADRDGDALFYVHRATGPVAPLALRELSRVVVMVPVVTIEGDAVAAETEGTIVGVWNDGDFCDVEFADALGPASVAARFLRPL